MSNSYFAFKQFTIHQEHCAMKVTTDACVFGAWCAKELEEENPDNKKLLDIGTGTGILSLMIAQKNAMAIDAVEIEPQAAIQAMENVTAANATNIQVHHSDILNFEDGLYNYIVSNPPFYEDDLTSPSSTRSIAHHNTGLYLKDLLKIIAQKLQPDGHFFLLQPYKRADQFEALLNVHSLFIDTKITLQHSEHHLPNRLLIKGSKRKNIQKEEKLIIKEGNNYTTQFSNLLKDYYLYL